MQRKAFVFAVFSWLEHLTFMQRILVPREIRPPNKTNAEVATCWCHVALPETRLLK